MTDSKSTCCGKPVSVFSGDEGTNHWICGACGKACDVVTDSKTARELANRIDCMDPYTTDMADVIEQAILQYASDKDKRIAQLVEQMNAIRENFIEADTQVASLKSSLAEKESEVYKLQHRLCGCYELASIDRPCDGLVHKEDELNSLKEENVDLKQQIEVWRHHHEEHTNLEVDLAQAQLASLQEQAHIDKDFIGQYQREVASLKKENERLKTNFNRLVGQGTDGWYDSMFRQNQKLEADLTALQLENGVIRQALEQTDCAECMNDSHTIDSPCAKEQALFTSTKSSLMEKVRGLIDTLTEYVCHNQDCLCDQWRAGRPTDDGGYETLYGHGKQEKWYRGDDKPECSCGLESALTEVKKELPHA